jgi:hypothetical protein
VQPEFKKTPSASLVALILFFGICTLIIMAPPRWGPNSNLATLIDKHRRLEDCHSPKIVLIGGSNVVYGIDSDRIQKAFGRDVVDMGLGISFGLRYQLEEVKQQIKPGDLLVVFPEYCNFYNLSKDITNAHLNGSSDLLQLLQPYPGALPWVLAVYTSSPDCMLGGLDDLHRFLCLKTKFYRKVLPKILKCPRLAFSPGTFDPTQTISTHRERYNKYGDFVGHLNVPSPGLAPGEPIAFEQYERFNKEATDLLESYGKMVHDKNAELIIIPPPFPKHLKCLVIPMDIYAHWKKLNSVRTLASPERYSFEANQFFESEYHMNSEGRQLRTTMIIEDLTKYFNECSLAVRSHQSTARLE